MPLYESTFIARHDMSTQQVETLAEDLTTIIKDKGGEVAKTEFWGPRTLAYRIKKNRKGHYVFFNLDAPTEAVREYERNMRLNEDVLRYLTIRVDELDPNPSAIMQSRSARDDRSRRGGPSRDQDDSSRRDDEPGENADKAAEGEQGSDDEPDSADTTTVDADAEAADATPKKAKGKAEDAKKAKPRSKAKTSDIDAADDGDRADEDGETS